MAKENTIQKPKLLIVVKLPQPNSGIQPKYKHFAPAPHRRGKARLHAFLATYDRPDRDAGIAIPCCSCCPLRAV